MKHLIIMKGAFDPYGFSITTAMQMFSHLQSLFDIYNKAATEKWKNKNLHNPTEAHILSFLFREILDSNDFNLRHCKTEVGNSMDISTFVYFICT